MGKKWSRVRWCAMSMRKGGVLFLSGWGDSITGELEAEEDSGS
jgi:hypothetical protein